MEGGEKRRGRDKNNKVNNIKCTNETVESTMNLNLSTNSHQVQWESQARALKPLPLQPWRPKNASLLFDHSPNDQ